ncbi:molybdenum cofactor biosynthesis protein MoaB [Halostagnicola larsenii XH-48]|uniref:Molybdenum cofactor biosynthesis protein MoaB n=1 Tax=Halostagnicola larsenii XH-48 TaxID=797299 RepID=W0JPN0_9EURY|nr:molybdenum cofactor biosynthesis protein MoaB [Halostagnicola larsenii XH-48]
MGAAVVTISANGTLEEDEAGEAIVEAFEAAGHEIVTRELITSGHDNVQSKVSRLLDRDDVDIIVTAGGTGIGPDDATVEAVRPLLEKDLPAFADLFHLLAYDEVGTAAVTSRTLAGVGDQIPVFCLPNDPTATHIAAESIIVPEASRLTALATGNGREK